MYKMNDSLSDFINFMRLQTWFYLFKQVLLYLPIEFLHHNSIWMCMKGCWVLTSWMHLFFCNKNWHIHYCIFHLFALFTCLTCQDKTFKDTHCTHYTLKKNFRPCLFLKCHQGYRYTTLSFSWCSTVGIYRLLLLFNIWVLRLSRLAAGLVVIVLSKN